MDVITRIVRTRNIAQAIVEEAERRRDEIIVLGARDRHKPGQRVFGPRVDYVLRNAALPGDGGRGAGAHLMLRVNQVLAVTFVVLGVALAVVTTVHGGGQVGYLEAAVFLLLGILRLRATRG